MRGILLGGLVVLLAAGMANAFVLTVEGTPLAPNTAGQELLIKISGSETGVAGVTINASFPDGTINFTDHVCKGSGGWLLDASTNTPDPAAIYNSDWSTNGDGSGSNISSDFSMQFGAALPSLSGTPVEVRKLIVTTGDAGTYTMSWSSILGDTGINFQDSRDPITMTGELEVVVTPEPAALALLGLGGLFIRRRRA